MRKNRPRHFERRRARMRPPLLEEHELYCNGGCKRQRERETQELDARAAQQDAEYERLMVRKALLAQGQEH